MDPATRWNHLLTRSQLAQLITKLQNHSASGPRVEQHLRWQQTGNVVLLISKQLGGNATADILQFLSLYSNRFTSGLMGSVRE